MQIFAATVNPPSDASLHPNNTGLRVFTKFLCLSTLFLIFAGAMVKSTSSGLAVPDWPLSYGMLFPPMVGGVFYEHGHRMVAAFVGCLTIGLTVWLKIREPRRWVRRLAYAALGAVILQGALGGITVLFFLPTGISILHGVLAQIFFILTIFIAYSQSKERRAREFIRRAPQKNTLLLMGSLVTLIFVQLVFGALMRHTESGLAIPDFPRMGGQWFPVFNREMLFTINDWRFDHNYPPVTMLQVYYHFLHRFWAFIIVAFVVITDLHVLNKYRGNHLLRHSMNAVNVLVIIQIGLGVYSVLSEKSPLITSLHVVTGAALLGTGVLLFLRAAPVQYKNFQLEIR